MKTWEPGATEDNILYKYWCSMHGRLYLEVPIGNKELGNWPKNSKIRRIDGVLIDGGSSHTESHVFQHKDYRIQDFLKASRGKRVELIEAKRKLNRLGIGQVIAGVDMFERQYSAKEIIPVILCQEGDPALEWVCEKRNIKVHLLDEL